VGQAGTAADNKHQCRFQTIGYANFVSMGKQTNLLKLIKVDAPLKSEPNVMGVASWEWQWPAFVNNGWPATCYAYLFLRG
jgi:hypothetical protein